ncbi:hypothetical protein B0H19DRAFT_1063189 [Mycena capillaripes]|nr:hypothetical protein B0H19DRAFT_1063189 [Mycena capillaripes]
MQLEYFLYLTLIGAEAYRSVNSTETWSLESQFACPPPELTLGGSGAFLVSIRGIQRWTTVLPITSDAIQTLNLLHSKGHTVSDVNPRVECAFEVLMLSESWHPGFILTHPDAEDGMLFPVSSLHPSSSSRSTRRTRLQRCQQIAIAEKIWNFGHSAAALLLSCYENQPRFNDSPLWVTLRGTNWKGSSFDLL